MPPTPGGNVTAADISDQDSNTALQRLSRPVIAMMARGVEPISGGAAISRHLDSAVLLVHPARP